MLWLVIFIFDPIKLPFLSTVKLAAVGTETLIVLAGNLFWLSAIFPSIFILASAAVSVTVKSCGLVAVDGVLDIVVSSANALTYVEATIAPAKTNDNNFFFIIKIPSIIVYV